MEDRSEDGRENVATLNSLWADPSAPLASALAMEHHHPILSMQGVMEDGLREIDRERDYCVLIPDDTVYVVTSKC